MLDIQLLGGFAVWQDGALVPLFRTQKVRALLVYLALQPERAHPRPVLADLLWPDAPPTRSAHNLRQALTFLRQGLTKGNAAANLTITRQAVRLTPGPGLQIDLLQMAAQLEQATPAALTQAVDLYRGPLLDGFSLDDAPEFETWLLVERERWHTTVLTTLNQLAVYHRVRGEYSLAHSYLQRVITLDPWYEQAHRELMRLLALQGDTVGALAQFEKVRQTLWEHLGVKPLAETQALAEQIKQGLFPAASKQNTQGLMRFVGRGGEHARLAAAFTNLPRPHLILVEGESGIGKTRLLTEFSRYAAAHGAICLMGRCLPYAVPVPYQPLAMILRAALPRQQIPIAPFWQAELARLLPELAVQPTDTHTDGAEQQRLFAAIAEFLNTIGRPNQPLLLLLDDLHWADTASLDVIQFLLHQPLPRLLLLGTVRPEDAPSNYPLTRLRRTLSRERLVERVYLSPLDQAAIQAIAADWVVAEDAAALTAFLFHESEGNPFVLTELLYDLAEELRLGPAPWQLPRNWAAVAPRLTAGLRDVVLDRVERLLPASLRALQIAAVMGHTFDPATLDVVVGQPTTAWQQDWQLRHLVRPPNDPNPDQVLEFSHDKIRAVVYEMIPLERRQVWHGVVAQVLQQKPGSAAATLAHHFFHGPDPAQALPHLLQAAQAAYEMLAFAEVVILCTQALSLDPTPLATRYELLRQRQRAYQFLGDTDSEGRDAAALIQVAQQSGDPRQLADAVQRLGRFYYLRGQVEEARQTIGEVINMARRAGQVDVVVRVLNMLAMLFRATVTGQAEALRLQNEALEIARAAAQPVFAAMLLCDTAVILAEKGEYGAALDSVQAGLAILRANEASSYLPHALYILGGLWREIGQFASAQAMLDEALALCQKLNTATYLLSVHLECGHLALEREQFEEAQQHYAQVQQLAEKADRPLIIAKAHLGLGVVAYHGGDFALARTHLEQAVALCGRDEKQTRVLVQAWLGLVLWGQERLPEALQVIGEGMAVVAAGDDILAARPRLYWHYYRILLAAGQQQKARRWLQMAQALLDSQSATLPDPWREHFLNAVVLHRQIMRSTPERAVY